MSGTVDLKPFLEMLRNAEEYDEERWLAVEETRRGQEDFDRYLTSRGLREVNALPDNDGTILRIDREVERVLLEFESLVERQVRDQEDAIDALNDIRRALNLDPEPASAPKNKPFRDLDPDEPLTLIEALCLPELGGRMYADGTADTSKTVTMYSLRTAIGEGRLQLHPASRRGSHRISRTLIKEWMAWQDVANPHGSNSKASASTRTAASKPRSGSSNILTRDKEKLVNSAQASALAKLQKLRNTLRNG
ncbi:hypothetical protein CN203_11410 [Sinorhizobium meliloti]|nr:hypothetical protein CN203_11410 [Sinorhizobium meliloti]